MFPERAPKPSPTKGDWQTEYEACRYWDRPPRKYLTDNPYYPWLPPAPKFSVSFKLGFKP